MDADTNSKNYKKLSYLQFQNSVSFKQFFCAIDSIQDIKTTKVTTKCNVKSLPPKEFLQ